MALQTSVDFDFALSAPGVLRGPAVRVNTRVAEVAIQAGLFVVQGTADGQCKLPTSSGDCAKGLGFAPALAASDDAFPAGGTADFVYQIGDTVEAVIGQGYVVVEEAVSAQDAVYVRYDTGAGGSQKGAFRKSADTSTAAAVTGARYLTSASAGGLALVAINLPQ